MRGAHDHRIWPERCRPQLAPALRGSARARGGAGGLGRLPSRRCAAGRRVAARPVHHALRPSIDPARPRPSCRSTSRAVTSAATIPWPSASRPTPGRPARRCWTRSPGTAARGTGRSGAGGGGAPGPAPVASRRGGEPRRQADEAAAGLRRAAPGAAARDHRGARRGRGPRLRVRPAQVRAAPHVPHPARSRRARLRVSRRPRRQARPARVAGARHSRRRRLSDERPGDRDRRPPRHQRGDARHEQQLLGIGEGVPEALLRRALHRLRHRQPPLRRVRPALRRPGILRRASGPGRRCRPGRAVLRQAGDRGDPDRPRRVPHARPGRAKEPAASDRR